MRVPDENFGPETPPDSARAPLPLEPDPGADLPVQGNAGNAPSAADEGTFPVERPGLQSLHQQFQDTDPDRNAKVIQISRASGQPPAMVDQHLDQAQKAAQTPRSSFFQTIEDNYPGTTKYLQDPANMAVSKDDIPNLAWHERILRDMASTWNAEKAAFTAGALEEELGFTRYQQLAGEPVGSGDTFRLGSSVAARAGITETDPEKRAQLLSEKIQELSSQLPEDQNLAQKGLLSFTRFAPQLVGAAGYGAKYGLPAAGAAAAASIETGPGEVLTVPTAYGVAQTAGNLDYAFKYMTGIQYNDLKNTKLSDGSPIPDNVAKIAAVATGAAGAGLSLVKLGAILETIPGGKDFLNKFTTAAGEKVLQNTQTYRQALANAAKTYVDSVAHFTGAMVGITAANKIGTEVAKTAAGDTTVTQSPEDVLSDFGRTIEDAALTGGVAALPGTAISTGWELSRARQAEQTKQALLALGDAAKDSKTLQRMPEAYQQFVKEVTKDGPVKDVFVPAEAFQTYFQGKNIDPGQVADELGVRQSFEEAKQTGGDVQIPIETWATKIGPTEHLAGLSDDVRFRPDDLTVRERQQAEAEAKAAFEKLAGDQEQAKKEVASSDAAQRIQQELEDQLKAAGVSKTEARVDPQLQAAFFKTLGDRLGVDPYELWQRYPLQVQRSNEPIVSPEEHVLEQAQRIDGTNILDAFSEFKKRSEEAEVTPPAGKAESLIGAIRRKVRIGTFDNPELEELAIRSGKNKEDGRRVRKIMKEAQRPDEGPWRTDSRIPMGLIPNYAAEPTGVIGPDRITQSHDYPKNGAETDPLKWADMKYEVTKQLIKKHQDAGLPLTINTSSDLVAHDDYVRSMPPDTTVRMHLLTRNPEINRALFPANPSRARQETAIERLKENGVKVTTIRPTVDEVIDAAGGIQRAANQLGASKGGARRMISEALDPSLRPIDGGKEFHQEGGNEPRGRIRFGTQGSDKIFNIDLLKRADKSTFLHETGHYFLEVFGDVARGENAPKDLKDDYAAVLKWLGVEKPEDIGVEEHEKFARGFEAYLREGNAPSVGLRGAFNRFRDWLVKLYRDVKSLRVDLSPEVRGVMDRMLASQDEIDQARRSIGYEPEEITGVSKEAAESIRSLQDQARDVAENALVKEQMKEMTEKHQDFLDQQRDRITKEVREEIEQEPLYSAMKELDEGKGQTAAAKAQRFLKAIEKGEGADAQFETLAEVHGFKNGEDLARLVLESKEEGSFDAAVKARVDAGMQRFADMRSTDAIRQEALRQVHNEKMTELLAMEREALINLIDKRAQARKNRQTAAIEAKTARLTAKIALEAKPVKDATDASRYLVAERKAAQKVTKAIAEKDFEAAAKAKREQMLSHAMAAQAMKNGAEVEKILNSLSRFQKRRNDLLNMPYGFVRQVDDLLYKAGLGEKRAYDSDTMLAIAENMAKKGEDPGDIANATGLMRNAQGQWTQETLQGLVDRVNNNYYGLILPDSVMSGGVREYESMSLMDLRELKDTVQTISGIGSKHDRFLTAFEGVDIKQAAAEFAKSVAENYGTPKAKELLPGSPYPTKTAELLAKLNDIPGRIGRVLDTMLTLCQKFDGLKEGPAKKYIYRIMADAENARLERTRVKMEEVEKLFSKFYTPEEFARYKEKGSGAEFGGQTFTREQILSMALNWGNEGNRQRLRDGFQFSDETFRRLFSVLDKKDWDFAQATWDHIHEYWPEIAKLEMDVNGVQPQGVDPAPFANEHGDYRGGYYPIAYDFTKSVEAYQNNLQKDALYKQFSTARAATEQGHAQARVSWVKRPILLSLDVLRQHHEDVIHDLEYRKAVIDVSRFLADRNVKSAIAMAVGTDGYSAINDWLKACASGGGEPLSPADRVVRWLRYKATFYNMAFRVLKAPLIAVENVVNLSSELGLSGAGRALKDYYLGESGLNESVLGKSEFMHDRTKHLDRDMGDLYDYWQGNNAVTAWGRALNQVRPGLGAHMESFAYFAHAFLDKTVSFPLWADVYKRSLAESGDERLAIHQADESVKRTFMNGGRIDLPSFMRGAEIKKVFTTAYGYQNMMWNRFSQQRFQAKQEWIKGNPLASSALMARSYLYTFAVPAMSAALIRAYMRNSQSSNPDDEQKRFMATLAEEALPTKFIPIIRDIAPHFIQKAMGEHAQDIRLTALDQSLETLLDPYGDLGATAFQGKPLPEKWGEHMTNSISIAAGVPKEMDDLMFNFLDWQAGNGELTWRDAFSRRTKK